MSAPSIVEDIFLAALEKSTREERVAYLDAACRDDLDLRRRVERLIEAHPKAEGFLEAPARSAGEETAACVSAAEQVGAVIGGRYKLLELIGEGGMGAVWVAEQTQPVRRKVALKLIKPGMDSKTVLSRFGAERQALAVMDHPNIAKVLDGGTTETGRPYFVMEYVKGVPLTKYCDDARLSIPERLALFVPVCQAVQHAHQKGVIHRDLKPSNILVCLYDGNPVPKVIDFGLAKAIHQPLTVHTVHTAHGAMMGTPLYMSPEQAEFNNLDVDTRTDIYALGVILYELLTGTTPLEKRLFQEAAWLEMLRLIKEEEPQRPSVRLSSSATLPSLAAQRQLEPIKLTKLVRGELDWIVMKCLEKDRVRRYETATGLARDVERYLADELVEARPPTAGYRLRKFARKHRGTVTAAALVLAALLAGVIGMTWGLYQADRGRQLAEAAVRGEREERNKAEAARRAAQISAAGLQVDLDLAEIKADEKLGLFRLVRTLKSLPPESQALREFVTAAVLDTGQEYAQLLPPITHDGHRVDQADVSPDGKTLLTRGDDFTARLWDTRTGRPLAVLREGTERVVNCGFSPDGRTVFTDDLASVARFWDVPSGQYRAHTEFRPNRYVLTTNVISGSSDSQINQEQLSRVTAQIGAGRLLTKEIKTRGTGVGPRPQGAVELWDIATGRFVARLDAPGRDVNKFQFLGQRWLTTVEGSTLLVFLTEDGRLLARLDHAAGDVIAGVDLGPSGRKLATLAQTGQNGHSLTLRVWDTETWRAESVTTPLEHTAPFFGLRFWLDEPTDGRGSVLALPYNNQGIGANGWAVYRSGQNEPIFQISGTPFLGPGPQLRGDLAHDGYGHLYATRNWQRLLPPSGRKFHPDLARFAEDGRFVRAVVNAVQVVIDTQTDKLLPMQGDWVNLPSFGMIAAMTAEERARIHAGPLDSPDLANGATILLIPLTARLDLPADLLELWAQLAVRGQIGTEGQFFKWDEQTWEHKRRELASKPAPYPHFPFPGYVATDTLHWLRAEFEEAKTDADKFRLAQDLLRRAESAGDRSEAVRWHAEVERRLPKMAPPKP